MGENHIQLLYVGVNCWLRFFDSSEWVQVCDSLRANINRVTKKGFKRLFKSLSFKDRINAHNYHGTCSDAEICLWLRIIHDCVCGWYLTEDIAYWALIIDNAITFNRVITKREAECISEGSIFCGKQKLQDFWY